LSPIPDLLPPAREREGSTIADPGGAEIRIAPRIVAGLG
jgi:hypothetical protein